MGYWYGAALCVLQDGAALAIKADKNEVFPWACKCVTHCIAS